MAFSNGPAAFEVHMPADSDSVYHALFEVVRERHKLKRRNDDQRTLAFRSWTSSRSWGEIITAQVLAGQPRGSFLRLTVVGRFATVLQVGVNQQAANDLIAAVSERIRVNVANAVPVEDTVIVYRRGDGSEASLTCSDETYIEQLNRISVRGYTIINVIK